MPGQAPQIIYRRSREGRGFQFAFGRLTGCIAAHQGQKPHLSRSMTDGAPSITASALSRDTSPSDRRLRFVRSVFSFLTRNLLFCPTKARILNPAAERWFHQPSIRSSPSDHDSCFELPACAGRQGAQSKTRSQLRDQGAPRATLHGSHLRARGYGRAASSTTSRQVCGRWPLWPRSRPC
jgi:hypothetical protein